jgi:phosphoribosyl 1,2-cyclic phosphodiesterase
MFQNLDLFGKTIRFAVLGSGSRGNATVVVCGDDALLLDCGLSRRAVVERMRLVGLSPDRIRAICLTHEHSDHVAGARITASRLGVPVYMTSGCRAQMPRADEIADLRLVEANRAFRVGSLSVEAFPVPHDAVDTVGYIVGHGGTRLGFVTDLGSVRRDLGDRLKGCAALVLEFNHEPSMVRSGPHPRSVKERVLGPRGHLSNAQAAGLLGSLERSALRDVVIAHISEKNNTPELALAAARGAMEGWSRPPARVHLSSQKTPGPLLRVDDGHVRSAGGDLGP